MDIIDTIIDIKVPDVTGLNKSQMHDKFKSYLYDYLSKKADIFCRIVRGASMKEKHEEEQPYMSDKLVAFNHIYKEYNIIYHDAAMRLGLSNSEFDTLYAICELGDGCKQSDICRTTFIPKQTVNSAIRSLQKKEYLTLASGKGRSMHIYLTEQGLQLVRRTIFPMVEIENEAFPKLTEKEYKTILHFHAQYLAALREGIQKL